MQMYTVKILVTALQPINNKKSILTDFDVSKNRIMFTTI